MLNYCIKWPGFVGKDGYGIISKNRRDKYMGNIKSFSPSRVILREKYGRIRKGFHAHHWCYCRSCVNPNHIEEKTFGENNRDKHYNDRPNFPRIELSKEDVYLTKYLLKVGKDKHFVSNIIKVKLVSTDKIETMNMPEKLVSFIEMSVVWDYIHIKNYQKVEALQRLEPILPPCECLLTEWGSPKGYSSIQKNNQQFQAHIYSFNISHRKPIAPGLSVLHLCDNPKCIRPSHLFPGTQIANMHDKVRKKRHHRERLLDNQEEEIVRLKDEKGMSYRDIAKQLANNLGRKEDFCHKTILNIYHNFKLAKGENPQKREPKQYDTLYGKKDIVLNLIDQQNFTFRKASIFLGEQYRKGKPFTQRVLKEVYLEAKKENGESVRKKSTEILSLHIEEIVKMRILGQSYRSIARDITEKFNLPKPLHHNQIKSVILKRMLVNKDVLL